MAANAVYYFDFGIFKTKPDLLKPDFDEVFVPFCFSDFITVRG